MVSLTPHLNAWAGDWSVFMLANLWQSALLAGAVGLVAMLLGRASPAARYWLWQIVAVKMLLMPFWSVPLALAWLPAAAEVNHESAIAPAPSQTPPAPSLDNPALSLPVLPPADDLPAPARISELEQAPKHVPEPLSWAACLMVAWAIAVVAQLGLLLWQLVRLSRLLKRAKPASAALEALVRDAAARTGLTRIPRVLVTDRACSPFVCGLWRPTIVLPRSLDPLLAGDRLAPVIVHELAHVKRGDLIWSWIPQIARMLYFFNPVVYWVAFRIRLEGELACDGWAMAATGKTPGEYAELLVRIVGRLSEPAILRSGSAASAGLDGQGTVHKDD